MVHKIDFMKVLEENDLNYSILPFLDEIGHDGKKRKITRKMIENWNNGEDIDELSPLEGYKIKVKQDGEHKHDGQMVEYTFELESPKEKKTKIITDMCLMVGFNHSEDIKLK